MFFSWSLPDALQKRLLKFILRKAIGKFIATEIALDNLDVQLSNGLICLRDLPLNVDRINESLASSPLRLGRGTIGCVSLSIPWTALWTSHTVLTFEDVRFDVHPSRTADTSKLGSLSASEYSMDGSFMASSVIVAREFLDTEGGSEYFDANEPSPVQESQSPAADAETDGIHVLARFLDEIIAKLRISAKNIRVRYSMLPVDAALVDHLEMHIPAADFYDEDAETMDETSPPPDPQVPLTLNKVIVLSGITVTLKTVRPDGVVDEPVNSVDAGFENDYDCAVILKTTDTDDFIRLVIHRSLSEQIYSAPQEPLTDSVHVQFHGVHFLLTMDQVEVLKNLLMPLSLPGHSSDSVSNPANYTDLAANVLNDFITPEGNTTVYSNTLRSGISVHVNVARALGLFALDPLKRGTNCDDIFSLLQYITLSSLGKCDEFNADQLNDETLRNQVISTPNVDYTTILGSYVGSAHLKLNLENMDITYESAAKWAAANIDDIYLEKWNFSSSATNSSTEKYELVAYFDRVKDMRHASEAYKLLSSEPERQMKFKMSRFIPNGCTVTPFVIQVAFYFASKDIAKNGRVLLRLGYTQLIVDLDDIFFIKNKIKSLGGGVAEPKPHSHHHIKSMKSNRLNVECEGLLLMVRLFKKSCPNEKTPQIVALEVLNVAATFGASANPMAMAFKVPSPSAAGVGAALSLDFTQASVLLINGYEDVPTATGFGTNAVGRAIALLLKDEPTASIYPVPIRRAIKLFLRSSAYVDLPHIEHQSVYSTEYGLRFDPVTPEHTDVEYPLVPDGKSDFSTKFVKFKERCIVDSRIVLDVNIGGIHALLTRSSYEMLRYAIDYVVMQLSKFGNDRSTQPSHTGESHHKSRQLCGCSFLLNVGGVSLKLLQSNPGLPPFLSIQAHRLNTFSLFDYAGWGLTYMWLFLQSFSVGTPSVTNHKLLKSINSRMDNTHSLLFTLFARSDMTPQPTCLELALNISNFVVVPYHDIFTFKPLLDFLKDPEGLLFTQRATSDTVLHVNARRACIQYRPLYIPLRAAVYLQSIAARVKIDIGKFTSLMVGLRRGNLFIRDDSQMKSLPLQFEESNSHDVLEYFNTHGFVPIININSSDLLFKPDVEGKTHLIVYNNVISVNACADSFESLGILLNYIADAGDSFSGESLSTTPSPVVSKRPEPESVNMDELKDCEEDMFKDPNQFSAGVEQTFGMQDIGRNDVKLSSEPNVHSYCSDNIVIDPYYLEHPNPVKDEYEEKKEPQSSIFTVRVKDVELTFNMHDGYDWERPRSLVYRKIAEYSARAEQSLYDHATSYTQLPETFLSTQDDGSLTSIMNTTELKWALSDSHPDLRSLSEIDLQRSNSSKVTFKTFGLFFDFDKYEENNVVVWKTVFAVKVFEIVDNVKSSLWNKFCSYDRKTDKWNPRERNSNMLTVIMDAVHPHPGQIDVENRLDIRLLPLRLYIDQDALRCVSRFFTYQRPPNMSIAYAKPKKRSSAPMFFQVCDVHSISLVVDYKPKYVDFKQFANGNIAEIINFFRLEDATLLLKPVRLSGISGWDALVAATIAQWLPQLNSQISTLVSGVSGVRSVVNVGIGLSDLIKIPAVGYTQGKLLRGLHKGASSFAKATAMETIKLTTRLAAGTQGILEQADAYLYKPQVGEPIGKADSSNAVSKFSVQPKDVREGLGFGLRSLASNVYDAAYSIKTNPVNPREDANISDTMMLVMKAVPVALIKPMIGTAEAVTKTLVGIQNTIDPQHRHEMEDKYKG